MAFQQETFRVRSQDNPSSPAGRYLYNFRGGISWGRSITANSIDWLLPKHYQLEGFSSVPIPSPSWPGRSVSTLPAWRIYARMNGLRPHRHGPGLASRRAAYDRYYGVTGFRNPCLGPIDDRRSTPCGSTRVISAQGGMVISRYRCCTRTGMSSGLYAIEQLQRPDLALLSAPGPLGPA